MPPKKTPAPEVISLIPNSETAPRPRLTKLIIKNFRTIGSAPVIIDLDDIVVLVGANNAGKSSILRAYEVAMNSNSKEGYLDLEDFPNRVVLPEALPEVEVHTILSEDKPGQQWNLDIGNGEWLIRERWIWSKPDAPPKRQGFDVQENDWSDSVPWGAPNVANAHRPQPHRIDAFALPEEQANEISKLIKNLLDSKMKTIKSVGNTSDKTDYEQLIDKIAVFQATVAEAVKSEIVNIEQNISEYIAKIFHNYIVKLDVRHDGSIEKTYSPFKEGAIMTMGPSDGYLSTLSKQGSGARRTLLWTALKYISEQQKIEVGGRPHVLLIDEPEICLHPSATRDARKVLYDLPKTKNWQVMVTTHSPIFIDLSYDNTTIVRVDRNDDNAVKSTTLYRPASAKLSAEDKTNLKLLNICDPYVHEFFFGGRIIVVEGDTEYTVFSWLKGEYPGSYDDVHIIRARGKAIIPSVVKILNQFTCDYAVLHDTDTLDANGRRNPAWTVNQTILDEINKGEDSQKIRLIACKTNFETAIFSEDATKDKPYNAVVKLKEDGRLKEKVKLLLDGLLNAYGELPENCIRWDNIEQLNA